jgi:hypothetical protein
MDLGSWENFQFVSYPPSSTSEFGYLGVYPISRHFEKIGIKHGVAAGMNTEGLTCDMQVGKARRDEQQPHPMPSHVPHTHTLIRLIFLAQSSQTLLKTSYPPKPTDREPILNGFFCDWALRTFSNVADVSSALDVDGTHGVYGPDQFAQHFSLRDASGSSIVVEVRG